MLRHHCYREALRLARTPAEAEDIAQEAIVRVWRARKSCRSPDAPSAWAREIARNEAKRLLGRRSSTHELATEELPEPPGDAGEDSLLVRLDVERALDRLSPSDRLLVRLRYECDLTNPNVAELTGMSVSNVKVRLHRLRGKLEGILST